MFQIFNKLLLLCLYLSVKRLSQKTVKNCYVSCFTYAKLVTRFTLFVQPCGIGEVYDYPVMSFGEGEITT